MTLDVVGLGYCVYDIVATASGPPDFDNVSMVPLTSLVHDGGGQVGTALTAMARLGLKAGYIGTLGDDREGRWLREYFVREGIDVARLRHDARAGTNICLILVEQATGRRAILCYRRVTPADLALGATDRAYVQAARVLHLDGQFMPAAVQAAHWAKQSGVKVCYDGNHPRDGLEELLPLVDWLVVAAPFPAAVTGAADPGEAASALLALGPEIVVVTQGERGCLFWSREEHFQAPGFPVQAVDTTGAGDAFHGAFVYAMLQGWDPGQVARFSNAVAAMNCLSLGGRRGLPTLGQVSAWLEGMHSLPTRLTQ